MLRGGHAHAAFPSSPFIGDCPQPVVLSGYATPVEFSDKYRLARIKGEVKHSRHLARLLEHSNVTLVTFVL